MKKVRRFIFNYIFPMFGMLFRMKNRYVNVVYYHDIVRGKNCGSQQTNIDLFKRQMRYLKSKGYKTLCFSDLEDENNLRYHSKKILITFDDGWVSNYDEIFEYMKEMNIKYNIFLDVGSVGIKEEYLTWNMVREMRDSGLVGFGAHTYSHCDMSDISKIDPKKEIDFVNQKIIEETGIKPLDFCYPYGKWSEEANSYLVKNTEYKRIYTSKMMHSYMQDGKIIFGRSSINGERPFSVFRHMLQGDYNFFR